MGLLLLLMLLLTGWEETERRKDGKKEQIGNRWGNTLRRSSVLIQFLQMIISKI